MFNKIDVKNPVVELDGDEMTRIIWKKIREEVRLVSHPPVYYLLTQRPAHPALRKRPHQVLRSRTGTPRRDKRPSHDRLCARHPGVQRRNQMRDNHTGRRPCQGIQPQTNVEIP
jgi:hypothetical protein